MTVTETPVSTEAYLCGGWKDGEPILERPVSGLLNTSEPLLFGLEPDLEEFLAETKKSIVLEKTFELRV